MTTRVCTLHDLDESSGGDHGEMKSTEKCVTHFHLGYDPIWWAGRSSLYMLHSANVTLQQRTR